VTSQDTSVSSAEEESGPHSEGEALGAAEEAGRQGSDEDDEQEGSASSSGEDGEQEQSEEDEEPTYFPGKKQPKARRSADPEITAANVIRCT